MWHMRRKRGLRNWVIVILQRAPRNGAEIMNDMEVMTHGWWRPSPGSVYPLLEEMVQEGSLTKRDDGLYELAPGHERVWGWPMQPGPRSPTDVLRELSGLTAYLEDLKRNEPTATQAIQNDLDQIADRLRRMKN